MHHDGDSRRHRPMPAAPAPLLQAMAPYRKALVVAVAGMGPCSWRAALWADAGMAVVLGHALSLQALQGGQATNAQSDAPKMAVRLRGGLRPQASGYPATLPGAAPPHAHTRCPGGPCPQAA
jgi:hypothetical protein